MKLKIKYFLKGVASWLEEYGKARAAAELARSHKYQEAIKQIK